MSEPSSMFGPYSRPLRRDPAVWLTVAVVLVATAFNSVRAWSESASVSNALLIGLMTAVLTTIFTVFVVTIAVGIPRGWRLGRSTPG